MVPTGGTSQPNQQVFVVNPLKETAVYVARMHGGVRGGGREASPYSIVWPMEEVKGNHWVLPAGAVPAAQAAGKIAAVDR